MSQSPLETILIELTRRGVELRASGDRIRYRPKSAMTPSLVDGIARHREELLPLIPAVQADRCAKRTPVNGHGRDSGTGRVQPPRLGHSANRDQPGSATADSKAIPDGWTRSAWIDRLNQMATRCEPYVPDRADWLREWARGLERSG